MWTPVAPCSPPNLFAHHIHPAKVLPMPTSENNLQSSTRVLHRALVHYQQVCFVPTKDTQIKWIWVCKESSSSLRSHVHGVHFSILYRAYPISSGIQEEEEGA